MTTSVNSRAHESLMVVRMTVRRWYPRRFDRKASDELAKLHGAESAEKIGRFNKILVDLKSIQPLQAACNAVYDYHARMTAPWTEDGIRVMPARLYFDYAKEVDRGRREIATLARKFAVDDYAPQIEAAKVRLNGLFNAKDYPPASEIERRFGVDVRVEPLPDESGVRDWGLDPDQTLVMQREIVRDREAAIAAAHQHVVDGIVNRARALADRLRKFEAGETNQLRDPIIVNLREAVGDVLRGLNIANDPALTDLARRIESALRGVEAVDLRTDKVECVRKAKEIDALTARFSGAFGVAA